MFVNMHISGLVNLPSIKDKSIDGVKHKNKIARRELTGISNMVVQF